MMSMHLHRTNCIIFVFDVNHIDSFKHLDSWKETALLDAPDALFIVIGTKIDEERREVSIANALKWCRMNGNIPYIETSAKEGTNIEGLFKILKAFLENCCFDDIRNYKMF